MSAHHRGQPLRSIATALLLVPGSGTIGAHAVANVGRGCRRACQFVHLGETLIVQAASSLTACSAMPQMPARGI